VVGTPLHANADLERVATFFVNRRPSRSHQFAAAAFAPLYFIAIVSWRLFCRRPNLRHLWNGDHLDPFVALHPSAILAAFVESR